MEHASAGFERIALALIELQQRTEALLAENRQLQAELAAVRQGAGIMVATPGRLYPLVRGLMTPRDPRYPPR